MMLQNAFSPFEEMRSYETLWAWPDQTLKTITALFSSNPGLPSEVLEKCKSEQLFSQELFRQVGEFLSKLKSRFSLSLFRDFHYPKRLRVLDYPPELFYFRGDIGLVESHCVSVVGARECSRDGQLRAARLAKGLVAAGYTIVSGLAKGIDTAAMTAAIDAGGHTIGVIGTPINNYYPPENKKLQDAVAKSHLLISHVPFYRYASEPWWTRRRYFPERNETMAALSRATVIVEAGETSGSLTQARAALKHNRTLFILNSCFDSGLTWPHTYAERGAIRVKDFDDIFAYLGRANNVGNAVEEN